MVETKVYADNFSKSFGSPGDFLGFLGERAQNSRWMTARSKDLAFEPLEDGSPASNTISQNLTNGDDILRDTMANTRLLMNVNGDSFPVRSCALKSVLERARISGYALSRVSKEVFAEIINYCMGVETASSESRTARCRQSTAAIPKTTPSWICSLCSSMCVTM